MMTVWRAILLVGTAVGCLRADGGDGRGSIIPVKVTPPFIGMGLFYTGADVRIEGVVSAGSKVVVVVRGGQRAEVFNRKVRMGPIWITSGKVAISGVPSLFLRFTDGMLRDSLAREDIDRYQIDQSAIQRQMEIHPDHDHEIMVASWLSLKAHDGTYALVRDGVKMGQPRDGAVPFSVHFAWPRKSPPGLYTVSVYEYRERAVVGAAEVPLPVERVGFPAWLVVVVKQRSLLYGLIAVLVAAVAGFGIDLLVALVFGRKAVTAH